jgi:hypothetical protein
MTKRQEFEAQVAAITEPTEEQYAVLGRAIAAMLGSAEEWDSNSITEDISRMAKILGVPSVSNTHEDDSVEIAFWRGVANRIGVGYPDEEDSLIQFDDVEEWNGIENLTMVQADTLYELGQDFGPNPIAKWAKAGGNYEAADAADQYRQWSAQN